MKRCKWCKQAIKGTEEQVKRRHADCYLKQLEAGFAKAIAKAFGR